MIYCHIISSRNASVYFLWVMIVPKSNLQPQRLNFAFICSCSDFSFILLALFSASHSQILTSTFSEWHAVWARQAPTDFNESWCWGLCHWVMAAAQRHGWDAVTHHYVVSCFVRKLWAADKVSRQTQFICNGLRTEISPERRGNLAFCPRLCCKTPPTLFCSHWSSLNVSCFR